MRKWHAVGSFVAIKQMSAEERTASGIWIPPVAQKEEAVGTVLSVGPDVTIGIMEGDVVKFIEYSGTQGMVDGEPVLLISQSEIQMVWPKAEADDSKIGSLDHAVPNHRRRREPVRA